MKPATKTQVVEHAERFEIHQPIGSVKYGEITLRFEVWKENGKTLFRLLDLDQMRGATLNAKGYRIEDVSAVTLLASLPAPEASLKSWIATFGKKAPSLL